MKDVGDVLIRLRRDVEAANQERLRLQGEYDAGIKRLKADFGVESLEEAKALLEKQQLENKKQEDALAKEVQALQEAVYGQLNDE